MVLIGHRAWNRSLKKIDGIVSHLRQIRYCDSFWQFPLNLDIDVASKSDLTLCAMSVDQSLRVLQTATVLRQES